MVFRCVLGVLKRSQQFYRRFRGTQVFSMRLTGVSGRSMRFSKNTREDLKEVSWRLQGASEKILYVVLLGGFMGLQGHFRKFQMVSGVFRGSRWKIMGL